MMRIRWLVALISDTGMRLSEATGLHVNDIRLNEDIPYVVLETPPLATIEDQRKQSATYRLLVHPCGQLNKLLMTQQAYAFPRYVKKDEVNANPCQRCHQQMA